MQNLQYEPWGLLEASSTFGTVGDTSRVLWKGLAWEGGDTKLYFMRNRWFDPAAKRFVSEDPIGIEGGLNLYVFGANDPIDARDPSGLSSDCEVWEPVEGGGWRCTRLPRVEVIGVADELWPSGYAPNPSDRGGRPWSVGEFPGFRGPAGVLKKALTSACAAALVEVSLDIAGGAAFFVGAAHLRAAWGVGRVAVDGVRRAAYYASVNGGRMSKRRFMRKIAEWGAATDKFNGGAAAWGAAYGAGVADDVSRGAGFEAFIPFGGLSNSLPNAFTSC